MAHGAEPPAIDSTAVAELRDWLVEQALASPDLAGFVQGYGERLTHAGVRLWRLHLTFTTLHPNVRSGGATWRRDGTVETERYLRRSESRQPWLQSPMKHMLDNGLVDLRVRLDGPDNAMVARFPMLRDWQGLGMTDYLALMTGFTGAEVPHAEIDENDGMIATYVCDAPGGFTDGERALLAALQRRMGVVVKVVAREQMVRNILDAYLGPDAGRKVLAGQIAVGTGERIDAVIWMADLRGSTALSEAMPTESYLALLNRFFDCTAGTVLEAGGEILRLPGDAVVAIFPVDREPDSACRAALDAALEAQRRLAELNREAETSDAPTLKCVVVLHMGTVTFGNVGVPDRVEFTVIGPAVNEASRMEQLAKEHGEAIVASASVAGKVAAPWRSLGKRELRGSATPQEVFGYPLAPSGARSGGNPRYQSE